MKNYIKLSPSDAIRHYMQKDRSGVESTYGDVKDKLKDVEKQESELSITITLPTHRTKPDYDMDIIELKNLVNEAENTLLEMLDKRKAAAFIENIKEAQSTIDYSMSLDGMVIYANEHFSTVLRLPVDLKPEVLIGKNFDLRPLYKTRQQNRYYYILTVSRNIIRLIEAFNDKVIAEIDNKDFPFENRDYYVSDAAELMQDNFIDNQYKEFFNTADKRFHKYYNENPIPVILAGDVKMTAYYEEQMDRDCMVIAKVNGSFDAISYPEMMKVIMPAVEKFREEKQEEYTQKLDAADSGYLLSTDINEIYKSAIEGAAGTLYLGDNFMLQGSIEDNMLNISSEKPERVNRNDLLSELIRNVRENGGDIVFVDDDRMQKYNGMALVRRY